MPDQLGFFEPLVLKPTKEPRTCPCCGRLVKLYTRKLTSAIAAALIYFYREDKQLPLQWIHGIALMQRRGSRSRDFPLLRHWGLVEQLEGPGEVAKEAGMYRITKLGRGFVERATSVPRAFFQYNEQVWGWSEEQTDIEQALGDRFNYHVLMSS